MTRYQAGLAALAWIALAADIPPPRPPAPTPDAPVKMGWDSEMTLGGVGIACTGIGGTKDDPKWLAYPVRLEFANRAREYLIHATVTLTDGTGAKLFTVECPGAWLLMKLPSPAPYKVDATIAGNKAPTTTVKSPAKGQTRVILVFPQ